MRLISYEGKYDLPYEHTGLSIGKSYDTDDEMQTIEVFTILAHFNGDKYLMGRYRTMERLQWVVRMIRETSRQDTLKEVVFPEDSLFDELEMEGEKDEDNEDEGE